MGIRHVNQESASTSISSDEVYKKSQISIPSRKIVDTPDAPIVDLPVDVGTNRAFNNAAITIGVTPVATGGTATSYTAVSSPGGFTATSVSSPITIEGLTADTSYTFSVRATNITGSSPVITTTPVIATSVPDAPTNVTATLGNAGDGTASISFTSGGSGGKSISRYTVTSTPDGISSSSTSSPITISGLAIGTSYTFTVNAKNDNGTSLESSASNSVTPQPAPVYYAPPYYAPYYAPYYNVYFAPPYYAPPTYAYYNFYFVPPPFYMAPYYNFYFAPPYYAPSSYYAPHFVYNPFR